MGLFITAKQFSYLSDHEVERMKLEEGNSA